MDLFSVDFEDYLQRDQSTKERAKAKVERTKEKESGEGVLSTKPP